MVRMILNELLLIFGCVVILKFVVVFEDFVVVVVGFFSICDVVFVVVSVM